MVGKDGGALQGPTFLFGRDIFSSTYCLLLFLAGRLVNAFGFSVIFLILSIFEDSFIASPDDPLSTYRTL